ncbi:hypothetical protein BV20DRAFT_440631 [Pilatotrama ljubarskyi]|nr:hypothetical protein BV20DRAFT_440631 [Pilatotrama ljubarskyi]
MHEYKGPGGRTGGLVVIDAAGAMTQSDGWAVVHRALGLGHASIDTRAGHRSTYRFQSSRIPPASVGYLWSKTRSGFTIDGAMWMGTLVVWNASHARCLPRARKRALQSILVAALVPPCPVLLSLSRSRQVTQYQRSRLFSFPTIRSLCVSDASPPSPDIHFDSTYITIYHPSSGLSRFSSLSPDLDHALGSTVASLVG